MSTKFFENKNGGYRICAAEIVWMRYQNDLSVTTAAQSMVSIYI